MCASVYFQDVTQEFVNHYIELMNEDPKKTEPMYDTNAKLVIGKETFLGHAAVCNKIQSLGKLTSSSIHGQPYGDKGDVLISVKMRDNLKNYIYSFVLHEIEQQKHRFAIILQVIHPLS